VITKVQLSEPARFIFFKQDAESKGKKLHKQDEQLLILVQNVLFMELALALDITFEEVNEMVNAMIKENCKGC
jgi:RNA polymerase-interacting CarD/CdnL/TRCF family regulator